jgi:uncharacterized protein YegP (UPF0339 family)
MTSYPDVDIDDLDNPELSDADVARMRPGAEVLPLSVVGRPVFEVYTALPGEWRWTLKSADGRILATSSEAYASRQKALEIIEAVKSAGRASPVIG